MTSGIAFIGIVLGALAIYLLAVWRVRKWMLKQQVACFWRSTFLAVVLAPGLLLFGQHAVPLPTFAWMSGVGAVYNCIENGLFCDIKLNLYLSILPFLATWVFALLMCKGPEQKTD